MIITLMCNLSLKNDTNELLYKTDIYLSKTNVWLPKGELLREG